jgi:hypothetical protein
MRPWLAALLLTLPAAAGAIPPRLPPADYCRHDRSFVAFRNGLRTAIARRDAAFILRTATENIRYSNADDGSREGFARFWGLDHPATSRFWGVMAEAMRLGCTPDEGADFIIPAMAQVGDEDDRDDSMMMVAVRPGAALRARPSDSSPVIARLRWDVVTLRDRGARGVWLRATLDDGRRGYIRRNLFRRFDDYSAVFAQREGRWRMISFSGIE